MQEDNYYDYAGFGERLLALLIDGFIIGAVLGVIGAVVGGVFVGTAAIDLGGGDGEISDMAILTGIVLYIMFIFGAVVAGWLYYALQESSPKMATFGKRAMGLVVTDMDGHRISFAKATGRFFGKWISGAILYVGYIMAAFTEKKQALHDMIANTLVMKDH